MCMKWIGCNDIVAAAYEMEFYILICFFSCEGGEEFQNDGHCIQIHVFGNSKAVQ